MAPGETGFDDLTDDLMSVQFHAQKAGHDCGSTCATQQPRRTDIAEFFGQE